MLQLPNEQCFLFFHSLNGDVPEIRYAPCDGNCDAEYDTAQDVITIDTSKTKTSEDAWSRLYHEIIHRQLLRKSYVKFYVADDDIKAFEEIIAEVAASFICEQTGILNTTLKYHITYLQGWKSWLNDQSLLYDVVAVVAEIMEDLFHRKVLWMDIPIEILECLWSI